MRRLSIVVAALAIACLGFVPASAQSVDNILAGYFEATGGMDNWKNLKSLKSTAKMMQGGMEFPAVMMMKSPDKFRMDIEVQGLKIVQAYDGKDAWTINPMMQITEPKKLTEEEGKALTGKTIESDFLDYKTKGHTIEVMEGEEVDGLACNQLKLTKKDGGVEYHFFDKETSIPVMIRVIAEDGPMKGQPIETFMGDYDSVGDFFMPFSITTKVQGQTMMQIVYENYEVNGAIDDAVFAMPAK